MIAIAPMFGAACAMTAPAALAAIYIGEVFVSQSHQMIAAAGSLLRSAHVPHALALAMPFPLSWIGWVATTVFVCSYLTNSASRLRLIQAIAASLWTLYGIAIGAMPVIVANVIVTIAAGYSFLRQRAKSRQAPPPERTVAVSNTISAEEA